MSSTKRSISPTLVRGEEGDWQFSAPGVSKKVLHDNRETGESSLLLRFEAGSTYPLHNHPGDEEILALEGDIQVGKQQLRPGDYLHTPPEGKHAVSSQNGCLVFLRLSKPIEILDEV